VIVRSALVGVWFVVACGGPQPSGSAVPDELLDGKPLPMTETEKQAERDNAAREQAEQAQQAAATRNLPRLELAAACTRFNALAAEGCSWTQRFPPEFRRGNSCQSSLATWVSPSTPDHAKLQSTINCWALHCEAAAQCMVDLQKAAPSAPPRACGEEGTGPVLVDADTWAKRRGAGVKKFSSIRTSEAEPVEVCGIEDEVAWMTKVTCNDGSNPYRTPAAANESRDSWMARGGRCNSILDRYTVRCPEATYTIHVDRYVCPER
jgi:hypothetical protein